MTLEALAMIIISFDKFVGVLSVVRLLVSFLVFPFTCNWLLDFLLDCRYVFMFVYQIRFILVYASQF